MKFDPKDYLVDDKTTLMNAMKKLDDNHSGFLFTTDKEGSVNGLATDGDIRRALLNGINLSDSILKCANKNFFYFHVNTPREKILKRLDEDFQFVPLLDANKKLCSIITRDYLPLREEEPIYVRARAPVRVSFGGGGSDLTHYFSDNLGAVINATISLYSHATLRIRSDSRVNISSLDLNESLSASNLDEAINSPKCFGLIIAVLKIIKPSFGFDLYLHSDFSVGSGLGGSATVVAAILGCFNMLRQDQWDRHEIAELAFQAERILLGIAGGWQDQYATVFGGFNFIEFGKDPHVVTPIRLHKNTILELEESLVLCDTGILHNSNEIHKDQKDTAKQKNVADLVAENVRLTYSIRNCLLRGQLSEFGSALNRAWELKRNFSSQISSAKIDEIYREAMENGANGGKLLGAGGGGFFLFHVSPFRKHELCNHLKSKGLQIKLFRFESSGLQAWSIRDM
jgi:D-glycero-alpha-D-manno-heptose-7-phosphate kinase